VSFGAANTCTSGGGGTTGAAGRARRQRLCDDPGDFLMDTTTIH